jgi:hypothetical protein
MTIVLRNDSFLVDVTPFGPGSIVYLPVPAPQPRDLAKPHLKLVSPVAERIMSKIGGSMTGTACDITQQLSEFGSYTQVPLPPVDPNINVPAKDLPQLVGAYFGGYFACGVLHPTGHCMMRSQFDDAVQFCHVCRYALVEQIDLEQHWAIDLEYEKKYRLERRGRSRPAAARHRTKRSDRLCQGRTHPIRAAPHQFLPARTRWLADAVDRLTQIRSAVGPAHRARARAGQARAIA